MHGGHCYWIYAVCDVTMSVTSQCLLTQHAYLAAPEQRLGGGQGRIKGGQRGQLPRAPRCKGAPRDEIYLFQIKYSVEKFS